MMQLSNLTKSQKALVILLFVTGIGILFGEHIIYYIIIIPVMIFIVFGICYAIFYQKLPRSKIFCAVNEQIIITKGLEENFVFFWKPEEENGCFSQWYPASFTVKGIYFPTAEHYMMWHKAKLFDDLDTCKNILLTTDPKSVKKMGKNVRGLNHDIWADVKEQVVYEGNYQKFIQNPYLSKLLMETKGYHLAEASPFDFTWGIGLKSNDDTALNRKNWIGKNLLGIALEKVRNEIFYKQK